MTRRRRRKKQTPSTPVLDWAQGREHDSFRYAATQLLPQPMADQALAAHKDLQRTAKALLIDAHDDPDKVVTPPLRREWVDAMLARFLGMTPQLCAHLDATGPAPRYGVWPHPALLVCADCAPVLGRSKACGDHWDAWHCDACDTRTSTRTVVHLTLGLVMVTAMACPDCLTEARGRAA
jgi:hypothetical protein